MTKAKKFCIVIQPLRITQTRKRKKDLDLQKISTPRRLVLFQRLLEIPRIFVAPSAASEPTETSLQNTWRVRGSETDPLLIEGQTLKGCKSETTIPP